jgi:hypothetical protein
MIRESEAQQHIAQQATAERSFWSWLRRVPMKKEVIPPGGLDNPEFLDKVRPFLRAKETQSQFVSRTQIGPTQASTMTRGEIAALIEARQAADVESPVGLPEQHTPKPRPSKIVLDVF